MATIKKMPKEKFPRRPWRLEWRDSDGGRHFEFFEFEKDAMSRRDGIGHRMSRGERIVPSRATLAQFVGARPTANGWELGEAGWYARKGAKPSTRRVWESNLAVHILPRFGNWRIQDISRADVEDFAREIREKGKSPRTARSLVGLLHLMLADAVERHLILANPAFRVRVPRIPGDHRPDEAPRRNSTILETEAQVSRFLSKATEMFPPPKPWASFFTTALLTGARAGELLAIQWGDLELEGDQPRLCIKRAWDREGYITPKSKAAKREIPIFPEAKRALLGWRLAAPRRGEKDRVFPLGPGGYKRALRGLLAALREEDKDFPEPSLHALRHTFASVMAARGVPPKVLQTWLGHSKIEMTLEVYAGIMADSTERVVAEKLAGFAGV